MYRRQNTCIESRSCNEEAKWSCKFCFVACFVCCFWKYHIAVVVYWWWVYDRTAEAHSRIVEAWRHNNTNWWGLYGKNISILYLFFFISNFNFYRRFLFYRVQETRNILYNCRRRKCYSALWSGKCIFNFLFPLKRMYLFCSLKWGVLVLRQQCRICRSAHRLFSLNMPPVRELILFLFIVSLIYILLSKCSHTFPIASATENEVIRNRRNSKSIDLIFIRLRM